MVDLGILIVIGFLVLCGIAAMLIGQSRGDPIGSNWFVIGFLLGPIGVVWALARASPDEPEPPASG